MTRTVFCRKSQQELPGLQAPPYRGPKGQEIFDLVSQRAWSEWQAHQTMLINERRLDMRDAEARRFLQEEMDKFLAGEEHARATGYVPPDSTCRRDLSQHHDSGLIPPPPTGAHPTRP